MVPENGIVQCSPGCVCSLLLCEMLTVTPSWCDFFIQVKGKRYQLQVESEACAVCVNLVSKGFLNVHLMKLLTMVKLSMAGLGL